MRRLAAWLAIAAMALQALWPLVAQARPSLLVPVCSVAGETHYIELPAGDPPVDSHHQHCAFCFAGAAIAGFEVVHALGSASFATPPAVPFFSRTFLAAGADARAPPLSH